MTEENVSRDAIARMIDANNQTMMTSMAQLFQNSIDELKRSYADSSDAQVREIKKIKTDAPMRFKKKANEDQFRFNVKIQDAIEEAKAAAQVNALDKVKDSLQKGENLLKERQKHILLADRSEYGWSTVQEYKKSEIADDSDDEKKMFKAEARAKAHSKSLATRSRTAVSGFAPRKASVAQESGPNHSDERYSGLRRIPTVDSHNRVRLRPGNCFQCGKPGHWRAQCPTFQPKTNSSF